MEHEKITIESKKITDFLHHVDPRAFGTRGNLSVFIGVFDDCSIIFDTGSSKETKKIIRYMKNNKIPLSSVKYITTTHHHFDHNGGAWKLYDEIKKINPEVKILTNKITKELFNDYKAHFNRAKRTWGTSIGEMKPIEEQAFKINEPSMNFNDDPNLLDSFETLTHDGSEIKLAFLKTPGHTPDHQSPILIKDGNIEFIFLGEAVGTINSPNELITWPTSMPTYYNHDDYMNTLRNLIKISASKAGFSHCGVLNGKDNVHEILKEHEDLMIEFRSKIIKYYEENPETKHVVEKITPFLIERSNMPPDINPVFQGVILGLVYGMLMDLGYRKE